MTSDTDSRIPQLIVLTSVCLILAAVLMGTPLQSANDRSRWATVWSLVHRNTWQIDEIDRDPKWSTIDKVRHRASDDAPYHFYSSKPPLLSSIVAGLYAAERAVLGVDLKRDTTDVTRSLLVVLNAIPMALALWLFQTTLARLNLSLLTQCFMLTLAGVGSMLNPYLSTLNNHTPAAICVLICLTLFIKLQQQDPDERKGRDFTLIGLTAALTSCFELPAALFGVVTFLWAMSLDRSKTVRCFVPAAIVPLAAFFVTNWMVTGGIRPFYAFYGTDKYVYVHNGVPSYWKYPQGLDANVESPFTYLLHCLIGHHGLLSHTPAFILSIWGWMQWKRSCGVSRDGLRWVLPAGAGLSVVILAFYLSRTQNYNYGGNSAALRWMLWLTPFWWFAMLGPVERLLQRTSGRVVCEVLLAASIGTAAVSMPHPWRTSWIYSAMSQAGWFNHRVPVESIDTPRHSVIASWPAEPGTTAVWTSGSGGLARRFTARVTGRRQPDNLRLLDVEFSLSDKETVPCVVLLEAFDAGRPVEEWLFAAPDNDASAAFDRQPAPEWLREFVRGLPSARAFTVSGIRWFQQTPDSPGYRCQAAASRVAVDDPTRGRCWHRCDVWYCEDVAFGVLRWKSTVSQESTRETLSVEIWTAEDIR